MQASLSLVILQGICAVFSVIVTIFSLIKLVQKKSDIARILFLAFLSFSLALFFQVSFSADFFLGINMGFVDPIFHSLVTAYCFLSIGLYFLMRFALKVFSKQSKGTVPLLIWLIVINVWMIYRLYSGFTLGNELFDFLTSPDLLTILYAILIVPGIIFNGLRLMKKVKGMPEYPKILFITLMGITLFLTVLFFIVETVIGIITGEYENIVSYLAWPMAAVSLLLAYFGFYRN